MANCIMDIRFPLPYSADSILTDIKNIINKQTEISIIVVANPTNLNPDPLFFQISEQITGMKPKLNRSHGGSDGRFFSYHDIPVIISRPLVGNLHAENEWINIESMETLYKIYSLYVKAKLNL